MHHPPPKTEAQKGHPKIGWERSAGRASAQWWSCRVAGWRRISTASPQLLAHSPHYDTVHTRRCQAASLRPASRPSRELHPQRHRDGRMRLTRVTMSALRRRPCPTAPRRPPTGPPHPRTRRAIHNPTIHNTITMDNSTIHNSTIRPSTLRRPRSLGSGVGRDGVGTGAMMCDALQPTTTAAEVPAEEAEEAATAEEAEKAVDSRAGTTAGSVEAATCATVEAVGRAHP